MADGVIATDGQGNDTRRRNAAIEGLDVGVAFGQAETAAHGDVADVGDFQPAHGRDPQHMLVGSDSLHCADGPRTKPRPGAVRNAQVHRHADEGHVEAAKISRSRGVRPERRTQKRRWLGKGPLAPVRRGEHGLGNGLEGRIMNVAALGVGIFAPQRIKLFRIHGPLRLPAHAICHSADHASRERAPCLVLRPVIANKRLRVGWGVSA